VVQNAHKRSVLTGNSRILNRMNQMNHVVTHVEENLNLRTSHDRIRETHGKTE